MVSIHSRQFPKNIFGLGGLRVPPVVADEEKLAIVFTYFLLLSFFFFSYAFYFSPTSGNLPCVKICFPQYFGITRRYMGKKIFFLPGQLLSCFFPGLGLISKVLRVYKDLLWPCLINIATHSWHFIGSLWLRLLLSIFQEVAFTPGPI